MIVDCLLMFIKQMSLLLQIKMCGILSMVVKCEFKRHILRGER